MKLPDPNAAYSVIYRAILSKHISPTRACRALDDYFRTPSSRREVVVLLVDEIDVMLNRKQNVIYSLFDWPGRRTARLIVLCIANTMDLPELLHTRVQSRLGLTRLVFQAYTKEQIKTIVYSRLSGLLLFQPSAIELAALKINSTFGDARGALQLCRRALEICEQEQFLIQAQQQHELELIKQYDDNHKDDDINTTNDTENNTAANRRKTIAKALRDKAAAAIEEAKRSNENLLPVTPEHISAALREMTGSRYTKWLEHCTLHQKIWLASLLNANKVGDEAGQQKHKFLHLAAIHDRLCDAHGIRPKPTLTDLLYVASIFADAGICVHEYKGAERWPVIELKLDEARIIDAFKNDTQWSTFYTR
jgi:Cdc6-like AAA superfamily ATPase